MRLTPVGVDSNHALRCPRLTQKLSFVQDVKGFIGIYKASHVPTDKMCAHVYVAQ